MTHPIQLQKSTEIHEARATLAAEIEKAKCAPILAKAKIDWDAFRWDLNELTERSSPAEKKSVALIASLKAKKCFPRPWADLLRTLIVWCLEEKSDVGEKWQSGSLIHTIKRARHLIDHLLEDGTAGDVTEVSPAVIESYLTLLTKNGDTSAFFVANGIIARFIERGVAPQLSSVKVTAPRRDRNRPSNVQPSNWNEIVALGCAYQILRSPESPEAKRNDFDFLRYYTMLATLLVCAPSRVSELWRSAADIVVLTNPLEHLGNGVPEDEVENLDFKLALVWHPIKRGRPVIKPIPGAMHEVAQDSVEILRSYGEEARLTARWIMENPGVMPIAEEVADLRACRDTGKITPQQLQRLFGLPKEKYISSHPPWAYYFPRTIASRVQIGGGRGRADYYCFHTLEAEWWELFQKKWKNAFGVDWPYTVNTETYKLKADRALLLIFEGQIDPNITYRNKLFLDTPKSSALTRLLGKNDWHSVFQRLGIRLPDGSYPLIQTHDLRHFLNTMAQRAGIPEPIIAMWSGRRHIAQNAVYDHRTDAERLRAHGYHVANYDEAQADDLLTRQVSQAFEGTIAPPSIEVLSATDVTVRDLNRLLMISITQFGFCVGDLKSDPCPHAMNCLNCARLIVCKGAKKAKSLIEVKLRRLKNQRDLLREHIEKGGMRVKNDKILPHLEAHIAGAEEMLLALNDPDIEDGTIIVRKDKSGAIEASFADRVMLFTAEQRAIPASKTAIRNG